ncbi:MAG: phospholipid carrier-dependent glycosyltransferase [Planctomycetes bacterium]|nr:phospholipid carrier-dependent glycosyltransferase [Planctomycetota bacterium]
MLKKKGGANSDTLSINRRVFYLILAFSIVVLFWGVWWGWPTSFDQHDPTSRAIKMLWQRTLDPGIRYWGSFGYQEVLLISVLPITALKKIFALDQYFAEALMFLTTRVLWALKGIGIILMSYILSKELFQDRRAALITMAMLALAPGFVAWSHIPQVDLVHCFWYTASVTITAIAWRRNNLRLLWLAAVTAGFAAGTKYVGGIIVLAPMAATFLLLPAGRAFLRVILLGVAAVFVFFLTTPLVTGDPISWLPAYTADVLANSARDTFRPLALWTMPGTISEMVGPGTALIGILGLVLMFIPGKKRGAKSAWFLLLISILPYYLIFIGQHLATVRYMIPISGTLLVAIGFLISRGLDMPQFRSVTLGIITLAFLVQAVLVIALGLGFTFDTRVELAKWLENNTEKGNLVETVINHRPYFSSKHDFIEVTRPHFQAESYQMHRDMMSDQNSNIRKLHETMLRIAGFDSTRFKTWVDKEREWLENKSETFDTTLQGPAKRGEKYIIINLNTVEHYVIDWPGIDPYSPNEKFFFHSLINDKGPFRLVASFDPPVPEWLRYPKELWRNISPPVRVYEVL